MNATTKHRIKNWKESIADRKKQIQDQQDCIDLSQKIIDAHHEQIGYMECLISQFEPEPEELSQCCGAVRADPDQDFCSQCMDHAEFSTGDE